MADQKLSELTTATTIGSTDLVYAVIGGNSRKITRDNFTTSLALGTLTSNIGTSGTIASTSTVTGTKLVPTGNVTAGNGMYLPATNAVAFSTNGSERVRILAGGNVGIGLTAPNELLEVAGNIHVSGGNRTIFNRSNNSLSFGTNNTARMIIDANGTADFVTTQAAAIRLNRPQGAASSASVLSFRKSRGTTATSVDSTNNNDFSGNIIFEATDGTDARSIARIAAAVDSTPATDDIAGRLVFFTRSAGVASTADQRMVIKGDGKVGINTISPNASAQVDIASTTGGFLPPRMTGAQRDAIGTPAAGLIVYNTTSNKLNFYNGSAWRAVDDSAV